MLWKVIEKICTSLALCSSAPVPSQRQAPTVASICLGINLVSFPWGANVSSLAAAASCFCSSLPFPVLLLKVSTWGKFLWCNFFLKKRLKLYCLSNLGHSGHGWVGKKRVSVMWWPVRIPHTYVSVFTRTCTRCVLRLKMKSFLDAKTSVSKSVLVWKCLKIAWSQSCEGESGKAFGCSYLKRRFRR